MKTIESLTAADSFLKREYYQLWADYFIKFFEAYAEHNVTFWATTIQNEPATGYIGVINSMAWTVEQLVTNEKIVEKLLLCVTNNLQITFLTKNLGPTIRGSKFADTDILIHDDQTIDIALVQQVNYTFHKSFL